MFLAIDIGNTAIKAGVIRDGRLEQCSAFPAETASIPLVMQTAAAAGAIDAVVCAVRPALAAELTTRLEAAGGLVTTADYRTIPLINRYEPPSAVGSDRLVAAYAVNRRFGRDAIVIDMGTAVTIDTVTQSGEYQGGLIFPGLDLLAGSLAEHTAQLPKVKIDRISYPVCALTTADAVAGGVFHGMTAALTGIVARVRETCGGDWPVYITGGYARLLAPVLPDGWTLIPDLILEGLILLQRERSHG